MTADFFFFFLNDPAPTEISPLPLPAPLPIGGGDPHDPQDEAGGGADRRDLAGARQIEPRPGDEGGGRGGVGVDERQRGETVRREGGAGIEIGRGSCRGRV